METQLRRAFEAQGQRWLHHQPQVRLIDGTPTGVEARAHCHSPPIGQVSPDRFIPLAEETGRIITLGRQAI